MSKKLFEEANIQNIASAIREKNGTQNQYTVSQMATAIRDIHTQPVLEALSVSQNGNYVPDAGKDGFSSVNVNIQINLESLSVSQNGHYVPSAGKDGFSSVDVNVQSQETLNWNENILCNWDFNNIVNTRGSTSYTHEPNGVTVYGFDGWTPFQGTVRKEDGGINLVKNPNSSFMLHGQFLATTAGVTSLFEKTVTISAIVDGDLGSYTCVLHPTGNQDQGHLVVNGIEFYFYRDSNTQMPFYILSNSNDYDQRLIQAVKAEFGTQQTLATQQNGKWILNRSVNQPYEYFRVRAMVRNG